MKKGNCFQLPSMCFIINIKYGVKIPLFNMNYTKKTKAVQLYV